MIKVLAIDDDNDLVNKLIRYFNNTNISIIESAKDGLEAITKIKNDNYDVILLDLIMPNKDGLYVLEYMKEYNISKSVIVLTGNRSILSINEVTSYDVDYYVLKPFDYDDLKTKIDNISNRNNNSNVIDIKYRKIEKIISQLLHELGVPSSINGYKYIKDSILYLYFDNTITGFTTALYKLLSDKYDVSIKSIDRAISHAIETSYNRGNLELINDIFSYSVDDLPTNKEYILGILEKIKSLQL